MKIGFLIIMRIILNVFFCRCGPIFGAGADLLISNACNTNLDSYSNLPHSYEGVNASFISLFGDYNFTIIEYEIYTLANPPPSNSKLY